MATIVKVDPERAEQICKLLLDGHSTPAVGQSYGKSSAWVSAVAHSHGLVYSGQNQFDGKWIRKEQATMDNGAWNLTNDEYNDLLTPERERSNGSTIDETTAAAAETIADQAIIGSLDDDIKEALDLLAQAEKQRREDMTTIANLQTGREQNRTERKKLEAQLEALQTRVDQLDVENKRLQNELKREISRGFLRQSMDSLRKVL
jgi:hypothetical protein